MTKFLSCVQNLFRGHHPVRPALVYICYLNFDVATIPVTKGVHGYLSHTVTKLMLTSFYRYNFVPQSSFYSQNHLISIIGIAKYYTINVIGNMWLNCEILK